MPSRCTFILLLQKKKRIAPPHDRNLKKRTWFTHTIACVPESVQAQLGQINRCLLRVGPPLVSRKGGGAIDTLAPFVRIFVAQERLHRVFGSRTIWKGGLLGYQSVGADRFDAFAVRNIIESVFGSTPTPAQRYCSCCMIYCCSVKRFPVTSHYLFLLITAQIVTTGLVPVTREWKNSLMEKNTENKSRPRQMTMQIIWIIYRSYVDHRGLINII